MRSSKGRLEDQPPRELRRVLNVLLGVAIVVGGAVGVGILRTPGVIAGQLGQPWLITLAWVTGGLLALLGANCLAEVAAAIPRAGGPYVYAQRAFGAVGGMTVGWADWLVSMTSMATISVAIAEYVAGEGRALVFTHALAVGLIVAFALLNWFGLKVGARTQQLLSLFKVAGLLALAGLALAAGSGAALVAPGPTAVRPTFLILVSAVVIIHEVYAGWNSSVYFSEEDQDAGHNAPRALFWGIVAIMIAYVLFNLGLMALLPNEVLVSSALPAGDAAQRIFGAHGNAIVRVFAVISLCGILNVIVMFTPRILFGMSRDGLLPSGLSKLNAAATPGIAMIACVIPAMLLASGLSFEILFSITAFLGLFVNLACFLAYFRLRRIEPELQRPFRAFGHPWLPLATTLISAALLVAFVFAEPFSSSIAIVAMLLGWPLFKFTSGAKAAV